MALAGSMERLLIVAGSPAAGKSTLIARLVQGDTGLQEAIGLQHLGDLRAWRVRHASALSGERSRARRTILHFAIGTLGLRRRVIEGFAREAVEITCLTTWTDPAVLEQRLELRRRSDPEHAGRYALDAARLSASYEEWFALSARLRPAAHVLVDTTVEPVVAFELSQWPALKAERGG